MKGDSKEKKGEEKDWGCREGRQGAERELGGEQGKGEVVARDLKERGEEGEGRGKHT